jgi:hypothetical protein
MTSRTLSRTCSGLVAEPKCVFAAIDKGCSDVAEKGPQSDRGVRMEIMSDANAWMFSEWRGCRRRLDQSGADGHALRSNFEPNDNVYWVSVEERAFQARVSSIKTVGLQSVCEYWIFAYPDETSIRARLPVVSKKPYKH